MKRLFIGCLVWSAGCVEDRTFGSLPLELSPLPPTTEVDKAFVALESVHLDSPVALGAPRVWGPGVLVSSVAHAHPGHGETGSVVGEWLGPWSGDLLDDRVELGTLGAYSGLVGSGLLTLASEPAVEWSGTLVDPDSGTPIPFSYVGAIDHAGTLLPLATTIPTSGSPGTLVLTVDLDRVLSFVDPATADDNADGVLDTADDSFRQAFEFGLTSAQSWALTLEP